MTPKLIQLPSQTNKTVYINPQLITSIEQGQSNLTFIHLIGRTEPLRTNLTPEEVIKHIKKSQDKYFEPTIQFNPKHM